MPPLLALGLCTVFVFVLLRMESKEAGKSVSLVSWLPTVWLLSVTSKPLAAWFGSMGDPEAGSPLDRNFQTLLLLIGLAVLANRRVNWSRALVANRWFMVLVIFKLASIFWSDIPFVSFKRGVREFVAVVMAGVILSERNPRATVESMFRRTVYILLPYSLVLVKYFPKLGVLFGRWSGDRMWVGVTLHKTGLGCLCMIAVFFLLWTYIKRRQEGNRPAKYQTYAEVIVAGIAVFLMFFSPSKNSATAILSLVLGLGAMIGLVWMRKWRLRVRMGLLNMIVVFLIAFGTAMPFTGGAIAAGINASLGRDASFTGRAPVWQQLVPVAMESPIFGAGLGSFWTPKTRDFYQMSHAHSAYLEILLEFGFFGLFAFALFVLALMRHAHRELSRDYNWGSFCLCYLLMALLHGFVESSINSFIAYLGAVFGCLMVSCNLTPKALSAAKTASPRRVAQAPGLTGSPGIP